MTLADDLNRDEGVRLKPYLDCCSKPWRQCDCVNRGKLTIGVGRNLDDVGISVDEAFLLRDNDTAKTRSACNSAFPWYVHLTPERQDVVANMVFNLGLIKFCDFKQMIDALARGDYPRARAEMLSSHWASEVGERAKRLADAMSPSSSGIRAPD